MKRGHCATRGAHPNGYRRRPEGAGKGMVSSAGGTTRWPIELRLKRAERLLEIAFDDGRSFRLPAEYLRVESPSAEVQGHGPGQKTLVDGRAHVGIMGLEPIGNYALRRMKTRTDAGPMSECA